MKYLRVFASFQSYGLNFTQSRFEKAMSGAFDSTHKMHEGIYANLGVNMANSSFYSRKSENMIQSAKSSIGMDNSTSTGDARGNFLQDRILFSIADLTPVNDVSFRKNVNKMFRLGAEMGKELLTIIPEEHKEKLKSITLTFNDDSFFLDRFFAKVVKFLESSLIFVETVFSYVVRGLTRFMNLLIQISTTLLELPVYLPFISGLWSNVIAPGTGDMSLMSVYCLIGGIPATLFYRLYRGREPFSSEDITALETVKLPQLFIYTWNHHALTQTDDPHELKRRNAVFDWYDYCFFTLTGFLKWQAPT